MNILKAIIGMGRWKKRMKALEKKEAYTDEWWDEVVDSVEFLPEEGRADFVDSYVRALLGF